MLLTGKGPCSLSWGVGARGRAGRAIASGGFEGGGRKIKLYLSRGMIGWSDEYRVFETKGQSGPGKDKSESNFKIGNRNRKAVAGPFKEDNLGRPRFLKTGGLSGYNPSLRGKGLWRNSGLAEEGRGFRRSNVKYRKSINPSL